MAAPDQGFEETVVFDFGPTAESWPNIDDSVMGGRSRSTMRIGGGIAVFEGYVSLANNGGFASLRSRPAEYDLHDYDGVVVRVLGDGKTYGVRLRTDAAFDGVSYQAPLATESGRWAEVRLPFSAFRPAFRGREVKGCPALAPGAIKTFGLIIAERQDGPFRLEIDWIKRSRHSSAAPGSPEARRGSMSIKLSSRGMDGYAAKYTPSRFVSSE